MTNEESTPDGFARLFQPWIVQLRTITEGLAGMTGLSESLLSQPVLSLQGLPLPGALSAVQQAQLTAFYEQLALLEGILGPLAEWSRTWADFEGLVMNARRNPEPEG